MKIFVFSEERWESRRVMGLSLIMTLEEEPSFILASCATLYTEHFLI